MVELGKVVDQYFPGMVMDAICLPGVFVIEYCAQVGIDGMRQFGMRGRQRTWFEQVI